MSFMASALKNPLTGGLLEQPAAIAASKNNLISPNNFGVLGSKILGDQTGQNNAAAAQTPAAQQTVAQQNRGYQYATLLGS